MFIEQGRPFGMGTNKEWSRKMILTTFILDSTVKTEKGVPPASE
jgi:hypothetical protein